MTYIKLCRILTGKWCISEKEAVPWASPLISYELESDSRPKETNSDENSQKAEVREKKKERHRESYRKINKEIGRWIQRKREWEEIVINKGRKAEKGR